KLDRWMKQKVGNWQGVDLLTEKDRQAMEREQNLRWMARSYRRWWYGHTLLFIVVHSFFWLYFGNDDRLLGEVLTDWSWLENMDLDKIPENGPYRVASIYPVSLIWGIVYIADTINAWYYTLFPVQEKRNRMYKYSRVRQLITTHIVTKNTGVTVRTIHHYDHISVAHS